MLSTPIPYFTSLYSVPFRSDLEEMHWLLSKSKSAGIFRIEPFFIFPKLNGIHSTHALEIY